MTVEDIAGYRVVRQLGSGGMGEVFLVEHPRLPRRDALKLLDSSLSGSPDFRARFEREAEVLAPIHHPNVVTLHDRGEWDGHLWLTMEFVDGPDAGELLRERGRLSPAEAMPIIAGAGAALDYVYRKYGLTHRDVKPANVLVAFERPGVLEAVKLADFGIAKMLEGASMTATGTTVGTVAYLSPEAIEGRPIDGRSDLYSLACTAFTLLAGSEPFGGGTPTEVLAAHLSRPVPSLSERAPGFGPGVDAVFARAMAKRPDGRFATCEEFIGALHHALIQPTPAQARQWAPTAVVTKAKKRRGLLIALAAVVVAALAVGAGLYFGLRGSGTDNPVDPVARAKEVSTQYVQGVLAYDYRDPSTNAGSAMWHTTPEFGRRMQSQVSSGVIQASIESTQAVSTVNSIDSVVDSTSPQDKTRAMVTASVTVKSDLDPKGATTKQRVTVTMDCTRDCLVSDITMS